MIEENEFIPVAEPALIGNEREYVLNCIDSSWISSSGHYVEKFETGADAFDPPFVSIFL